MAIIDSGESALKEPRPCFEIERNGNDTGRMERLRSGGAPFTEPLEQHVSPEGNAGDKERRGWSALGQAPHDKIEIARLSGMVQPRGSVELLTTSPEFENACVPAASPSESDETGDVVGVDRALQAVQQKEPRSVGRDIGVVEHNLVVVLGRHAL